MEILASEQYSKAQKLGLKYLKAAQTAGEDPYPAVLDEIERDYEIVSRVDLGLVDVPIELVAGTRSAGRTAALAGNFMPILDADTEFGAKWIRLCQSHMEEGIRDPITCCEFLGKFYVQEGNKRVSVLKSFDAPTVSANVTRLLPARTGETRIEAYYEFVSFSAAPAYTASASTVRAAIPASRRPWAWKRTTSGPRPSAGASAQATPGSRRPMPA